MKNWRKNLKTIFQTIGCKIYTPASPRSKNSIQHQELREIWEGGWELHVKLLHSVKEIKYLSDKQIYVKSCNFHHRAPQLYTELPPSFPNFLQLIVLYRIIDLGDVGGYILQSIVGKIVRVFSPIFHYKLLPKFPSKWNSGPDCTSLSDCARGAYLTTYSSELLG